MGASGLAARSWADMAPTEEATVGAGTHTSALAVISPGVRLARTRSRSAG